MIVKYKQFLVTCNYNKKAIPEKQNCLQAMQILIQIAYKVIHYTITDWIYFQISVLKERLMLHLSP